MARWLALGGCLAITLLGCQGSDTDVATCENAASYRTKGKALLGDMDADGAPDRVTLRLDEQQPARCRHLIVLEGTATAPVPPLPWPGTDPQLLLLAEIDGRPGLEAVVTLSPAAVYRPGAVFTLRDGVLHRLRVEGLPVPGLVPLYDEFPAGVDCDEEPGRIVVTQGEISKQGDRYWDVTRSFHRAAELRFELVREEKHQVEVGPEARRRWPEVRGDPFRSCPGRVDS